MTRTALCRIAKAPSSRKIDTKPEHMFHLSRLTCGNVRRQAMWIHPDHPHLTIPIDRHKRAVAANNPA